MCGEKLTRKKCFQEYISGKLMRFLDSNKNFWAELFACFHRYDMDCRENDESSNSSIVSSVFTAVATFLPSHYLTIDRLCGLVVRVLGYRSGGPGSIPGTTRKKSSGSGTGATQPREYS
jgi:hypothetical protein